MSVNPIYNATDAQIAFHSKIKLDRDTIGLYGEINWCDIQLFRQYTRGKHRIDLTHKQKIILKGLLGSAFCDNVCYQIIHEAAGRVSFTKWECKNPDVKKFADTFYAMARIQSRQSDIHFSCIRDGNYAIAVNWDALNDRVQIYKEKWWDGLCGIYIHYDQVDEPEYAVKQWQERSVDGKIIHRRLIWFPDRVERWMGLSTETWEPSPLPGDVDAAGNTLWPLPWLDSKNKPLGIPYIHFPNGARMEANHGVSDLDGGVLGFQDQLVDAQWSITATVRLTGYAQYYATGVKRGKSKTGDHEYLPLTVEPGAMHMTENDKAHYGMLPAGDIISQISAYNLKLKRVAQMTSTPVHIITGGDWPSGEALLRAELPAVSKANNQINMFKDCWTRVLTTSIKIWNKYKPSQQVNYDISKGIIESVFADPERRDVVSRSIVVHNLGPNISKAEGLRIMEYPEERVQQIVDEIQTEAVNSADAMLQAMGTPNTAANTPPNKSTKHNKQAMGSGTSNRTSGK